jgi:hypothetical protein
VATQGDRPTNHRFRPGPTPAHRTIHGRIAVAPAAHAQQQFAAISRDAPPLLNLPQPSVELVPTREFRLARFNL